MNVCNRIKLDLNYLMVKKKQQANKEITKNLYR